MNDTVFENAGKRLHLTFGVDSDYLRALKLRVGSWDGEHERAFESAVREFTAQASPGTTAPSVKTLADRAVEIYRARTPEATDEKSVSLTWGEVKVIWALGLVRQWAKAARDKNKNPGPRAMNDMRLAVAEEIGCDMDDWRLERFREQNAGLLSRAAPASDKQINDAKDRARVLWAKTCTRLDAPLDTANDTDATMDASELGEIRCGR